MGRGFAGIKEIADQQAARAATAGKWIPWLKVPGNSEVTVRFLEQDDEIAWAYCHEMPPPVNSKRSWGDTVACLDPNNSDSTTPCPACEQGVDRFFRGYINVIVRDAVVYELDKDGRYVKDANGNLVEAGKADQVMVWDQGITVFRMLYEVNSDYKGLMSRDFKIKRQGATFNDTKYMVVPADVDSGPVPMSADDIELAEKKYDLNQQVTPPSREDMERMLRGLSAGGGDKQDDERPGVGDMNNPFKKKKQQ